MVWVKIRLTLNYRGAGGSHDCFAHPQLQTSIVKHSDKTHNLSIFATLFLIGLFTKHHYRTPTASLTKAR